MTSDNTNGLPPLPEPAGVILVGTQAMRAFTADQMLSYAIAAKEMAPSSNIDAPWSIHFSDARDFCRFASILIGAAYTHAPDAISRFEGRTLRGEATHGLVTASMADIQNLAASAIDAARHIYASSDHRFDLASTARAFQGAPASVDSAGKQNGDRA